MTAAHSRYPPTSPRRAPPSPGTVHYTEPIGQARRHRGAPRPSARRHRPQHRPAKRGRRRQHARARRLRVQQQALPPTDRELSPHASANAPIRRRTTCYLLQNPTIRMRAGTTSTPATPSPFLFVAASRSHQRPASPKRLELRPRRHRRRHPRHPRPTPPTPSPPSRETTRPRRTNAGASALMNQLGQKCARRHRRRASAEPLRGRFGIRRTCPESSPGRTSEAIGVVRLAGDERAHVSAVAVSLSYAREPVPLQGIVGVLVVCYAGDRRWRQSGAP